MKYCKNCGAEVEENKPFCGNCGKPVEDVVESLDNVSTPEPVVETVSNVNQNIGEGAQNTVNQTVQQYGQQPVQPVYNQNNQNNKKSNIGLIIAISVLSAVIVGLVGFILWKSFGSDGSDPSTPEPIEIEEDDDDDYYDDDVTTTTDTTDTTNTTSSNSGYKFKNYEYVIPDGYTPTTTESYLKLTNNSERVSMFVYENEYVSYDSYVQHKDEFKNAYINEGYKLVEDIREETYLGKKMISFKVDVNGTTVTVMALPISSTDTIEVAFLNVGGKPDTEVKTLVAKFASYAKRANSSFSNKKDVKFSVKGSKTKIEQ